MSWTFAFVPTRLLRDEAFMRLDPADGGLLLRLYAACNRYGIGPANELALRADTGLLLSDNVRPALERLASAGLLVVYSARGGDWYRLTRYDEDAPADLLRKRGRSEHPLPPGEATSEVPPSAVEDAPQVPALPEMVREAVGMDTAREFVASPAPPSRPPKRRREPAKGKAPIPDKPQKAEPPSAVKWPGPRAEQASRLWLERLDAVAHAEGKAVDPGIVARLAQVAEAVGELPFCLAVDLHLDSDAQWWAQPIVALKTRCKWAIERIKADPSVHATREIECRLEARVADEERETRREARDEQTARERSARSAWDEVYRRAQLAAGQDPAWSRMLASVRGRVTPFDYKQWFGGLGLGVSEEPDLVVVVAPDATHAEWVRENYLGQLVAAFSEACDAPMRVEIIPPGQALGAAA